MKKYILKPGLHQFVPGSPAVHSNDNLTDEEAKWYLELQDEAWGGYHHTSLWARL